MIELHDGAGPVARYVRSSEFRTNGAIGRPTAFVMTSPPTTQVKARIYNDMNFSSR